MTGSAREREHALQPTGAKVHLTVHHQRRRNQFTTMTTACGMRERTLSAQTDALMTGSAKAKEPARIQTGVKVHQIVLIQNLLTTMTTAPWMSLTILLVQTDALMTGSAEEREHVVPPLGASVIQIAQSQRALLLTKKTTAPGMKP